MKSLRCPETNCQWSSLFGGALTVAASLIDHLKAEHPDTFRMLLAMAKAAR